MTDAVLSLLGVLISSATMVVVAIVETNNRKQRKTINERAEKRETESKLSMDMMCANIELSYVTSLAVTGGHTNGNVEAAQEKALKAKRAYEDFIRNTAAHAISEE